MAACEVSGLRIFGNMQEEFDGKQKLLVTVQQQTFISIHEFTNKLKAKTNYISKFKRICETI